MILFDQTEIPELTAEKSGNFTKKDCQQRPQSKEKELRRSMFAWRRAENVTP